MSSGPPRYLYLHGFASSPASRKASFFRENLAAHGISMESPGLDEGDFEHLTLGKQLAFIERLVNGSPTVLIGSSMGGYLAALFAARKPESVPRMLLLAPAFDLYQRWIERVGPAEMASWKSQGTVPVFHYGAGRELPLHYQMMEEAAQFEPFPAISQPALLIHGNNDPVVSVQSSVAFVAAHQDARLIRVESGHELTDVLDSVWTLSKDFLLDR